MQLTNKQRKYLKELLDYREECLRNLISAPQATEHDIKCYLEETKEIAVIAATLNLSKIQ